jgi:uncharacterized phage protein gp47/JayE
VALPEVGAATYPTPNELRDIILASKRYAYARRGITVNLLPGSDHYINATIYAERVAVAIANNKVALSNFSPLTATGDELTDLAAVFGLTRRTPSPAAGFVLVYGTNGVSVTIPAEFQATSPSGLKYQTDTANTITLLGSDPLTAPTIAVSAVGTGADTDVDEDTILSWDSAAIGHLAPTCVVDEGGIDGGADEDDDETLRTRLLNKLADPAIGGNAAHVKEVAEEATAAVEASFVHMAARGPGSFEVVVTAAGGDRTLSAANITTVRDAVRAAFPGFAKENVTSVEAEEVDVLINLTLPLPATAGGAGGGWRDAVPWPSTLDATLVKVTSTGPGSSMTVNATSANAPTAGRRFGIWDPDEGEMKEFTISSVSGVSGAYLIGIDTQLSDSMAFVVANMYVSAGAVNLTTYATEFLEAMQALGPGEKTANVDILPRAARHPSPDVSNPASISTLQLSALSGEHSEILDIEYQARYATGTTTPLTSPTVPTTTADPTKILVLNRLAFRASV